MSKLTSIKIIFVATLLFAGVTASAAVDQGQGEFTKVNALDRFLIEAEAAGASGNHAAYNQAMLSRACIYAGTCGPEGAPLLYDGDTETGLVGRLTFLTNTLRRLGALENAGWFFGPIRPSAERMAELKRVVEQEHQLVNQNVKRKFPDKQQEIFKAAVGNAEKDSQRELSASFKEVCSLNPAVEGTFSVRACIMEAAGGVGVIVFGFLNWLLIVANQLFNLAIKISVQDFKAYAGSDTVRAAWVVARDLVNLSLIFLLLYAALGLILNLPKVDGKRLVVQVVVVALLVNFSAFLTGIVIDASNVLANQFYVTAASGTIGARNAPDISSQFVQTFYGKLEKNFSQLGDPESFNVMSLSIIVSLFGQSLLVLITILILLAGVLMFVARAVKLTFVLVLSPLAFMALWTGIGGDLGQKWQKALINNAIFAPAFLFLMMLAIKVAKSDALSVVKPDNANLSNPTLLSSGSLTLLVPTLIFYAIVNGMMIGSLLVANHFGAAGAAGALGLLKRVKGGAGRTLIGKPASLLNRGIDRAKERMEESRGGRVALGTLRTLSFGAAGAAKETLEDITKSKFGGAKYSQADIDTRRRQDIETGIRDRRDNPRRLAAYVVGLSRADQDHAYDKLSARDRVALETELTAIGQGTLTTRLRGTLSVEEREKVEKAEGDSRRDTANRASRQNVNSLGDLVLGPNNRPVQNGVELSDNELRRTITQGLPEKQARRLSHNARIHPGIIPYLTLKHLNDLMAEGEVTIEESRAIRQWATQEQTRWMNDPLRSYNWPL